MDGQVGCNFACSDFFLEAPAHRARWSGEAPLQCDGLRRFRLNLLKDYSLGRLSSRSRRLCRSRRSCFIFFPTLGAAAIVSVGDIVLTAEVCPCSWMYNTDFQVWIRLPGEGGQITSHVKGVKLADATQVHVDELLGAVQIKPCACEGCNNPAFDASVHKTNRAGSDYATIPIDMRPT